MQIKYFGSILKNKPKLNKYTAFQTQPAPTIVLVYGHL